MALKAGPKLCAGIVLWAMVRRGKPQIVEGGIVLACVELIRFDWGESDRLHSELAALSTEREGKPPVPAEMPSPSDNRERSSLLCERSALCCESPREDAIFDPLCERHFRDHLLGKKTAVGAPELFPEFILFTGWKWMLKAERVLLISKCFETSLSD